MTADVKQTLQEAWVQYVQKSFGKSMATVDQEWPMFVNKVHSLDASIIRGEKFDMQFQLAVIIHFFFLRVM